MRTDLETFDYVIVGAGSAGCVLANRLSLNPNNSVVLLEAGGKDTHPWIHIPVGYLYTQGNPKTDWCFKLEPEPGLNGRVLNYPRGKTLGGCSSINGMIYIRGQARDYDGWRQAGNPGWAWDEVLPYFKKHEDNRIQTDPELHRRGGEWRVEKQRLHWDILDTFIAACHESGIPTTHDANQGTNEGVAYFEVNQRKGIRWSTAKGFLRPAKNRKNLKIITRAHAQRLVMEDPDNPKRVTAIVLEQNGVSKRIGVGKEIILSAGSIGSPQLLELSGIGRADVLQAAGIAPGHVLPGVGENLQDHLQLRTVYKLQNALTLNDIVGGAIRERSLWGKTLWGKTLWGKFKIATEYALKRSGPMAMAPSQLGVFTRSDRRFGTPNLQYHIQPLSLEKFGDPLHGFSAITASVCNLRPESRGHVHIRTNAHKDAPKIQPGYLSAPADRRVAVEAIRLTRKLMATTAMAVHTPEEYLPGARLQSDEDLVEAAGRIGTTIFHPVGTCKMGPASDPAAVVDARLRVHGMANVRVVDAGIMPAITSGNTNAPTLMIAEKAAAMILADA